MLKTHFMWMKVLKSWAWCTFPWIWSSNKPWRCPWSPLAPIPHPNATMSSLSQTLNPNGLLYRSPWSTRSTCHTRSTFWYTMRPPSSPCSFTQSIGEQCMIVTWSCTHLVSATRSYFLMDTINSISLCSNLIKSPVGHDQMADFSNRVHTIRSLYTWLGDWLVSFWGLLLLSLGSFLLQNSFNFSLFVEFPNSKLLCQI